MEGAVQGKGRAEAVADPVRGLRQSRRLQPAPGDLAGEMQGRLQGMIAWPKGHQLPVHLLRRNRHFRGGRGFRNTLRYGGIIFYGRGKEDLAVFLQPGHGLALPPAEQFGVDRAIFILPAFNTPSTLLHSAGISRNLEKRTLSMTRMSISDGSRQPPRPAGAWSPPPAARPGR